MNKNEEEEFYQSDFYCPAPTKLNSTRRVGDFEITLTSADVSNRWYKNFVLVLKVKSLTDSSMGAEARAGGQRSFALNNSGDSLGEYAAIAKERKYWGKRCFYKPYHALERHSKLWSELEEAIADDYSNWVKTRRKLRKAGELATPGKADLVRTEEIIKLMPLVDQLAEAAAAIKNHGSDYTKSDVTKLKAAIKKLPFRTLVELRKHGKK